MTNYPKHWLFSFGGTLLNGQEIWQNNIRFADGTAGPIDIVDEQSTLERFMDVLSARFVLGLPQGLGYSAGTRLLWGKFNQIQSDGRYEDEDRTTVLDLPGSGAAATASVQSYAPQLALAVSWTTDKTRGLAKGGRIFIPMPAVGAESDGQIGASTRQALATSWASLLSEFNNEPGVDLGTLVASVVSGVDTNGRSGAVSQITGVRVGSVLDTMRTRRNALVEQYSAAAVPD